MKKITITLLAIIATATTAFATSLYFISDDKPVTYDELPAEAKAFIANNFANEEISHILLDKDVVTAEYDVVFLSGTKLEFDSRGEWKEVDMHNGSVPQNLVPQAIAEYVKKNYPNNEITELKRDKHHTKVGLKGGLELTFNKDYKLVDVDD